MYAFVLPVEPSRKGPPHIVYAGDIPCAEEIFLHKAHSILDGSLAFRIRFIADPEPEFLLCAEVLKDPCLYDLAIGFACYEYSILINNKYGGSSSEFAEAPVDRLAGLGGIILVILCINTEETAVTQQKAYEKDGVRLVKGLLAEVDQHLLARRCIKNMIINTAVVLAFVDLSGILKIVDIVSERLLITGKPIHISVLYELLFKKIIDRRDTEIIPVVGLDNGYDSVPERGDIKHLIL